MTDRLNGFIVVLEQPTRDDDAQHIIQAIQMIKGVACVLPEVEDAKTMMVRYQVKTELRAKLLEVVG